MKELFELNNSYDSLLSRLNELQGCLDIEDLKKQATELYKETEDPSFWKNPSRAKDINRRLSDCNHKVETIESFQKKLSSCLESLEFLKLEKDPDIFKDADESLVSLTKEFDAFEKELFYSGNYDHLNAILEFHPGAGGTEAHDWASMLLRMYERYCEYAGYTFKVLDLIPGEEAGISSCTLLIQGKMAFGNLRSENGVHRLVRNSPFDADGARHTSFASVSVIPEIDDSIDIQINPSDLRIDTYHSSGAGGQNVNKTESAVRITHIPTGIVVSCQVERDQLANKETCMAELKSKLFQLELKKREEELQKVSGVKKDISFSSQIRSYVFSPYQLVKDLRSEYSENAIQPVMDGNIQNFIDAYLRWDFKQSHKVKN